MKAALVLLLCVSPALACDWKLAKKVDPMTDATMCMVSSASGKIAIYQLGSDSPKTVNGSAYRSAGTTVRVDDMEAFYIGTDGYSGPRGNAKLMDQLGSGQRLRIQYRGYPHTVNGDTEVCNVLELLRSCASP